MFFSLVDASFTIFKAIFLDFILKNSNIKPVFYIIKYEDGYMKENGPMIINNLFSSH